MKCNSQKNGKLKLVTMALKQSPKDVPSWPILHCVRDTLPLILNTFFFGRR